MSDLPRLNEERLRDQRSEIPSYLIGTEEDGFLVVGIGASAGGLEPCRALVAAIPANSDIACIIVQHLDPTHDTMMVELLATHTAMTVVLARDGMLVRRGTVTLIPPAVYLSIHAGTLHLSQPDGFHGARLPFDHLLRSMATDCGRRAACVVMSGGGTDGTLGLVDIKAAGGLVIVQDPDEAGQDGMPRSAIFTGAVDSVLPVSAMSAALVGYWRCLHLSPSQVPQAGKEMQSYLGSITDLLRATTARDFSLYKPGTLGRQVERRMAVAGIARNDVPRYLDLLRRDVEEIKQLATNLLIHVTSFFRDLEVFELLEHEIIPSLLRNAPQDRPLRIWIAGCSTGEESYSFAMLFLEQMAAERGGAKIQIFASDVDAASIAVARAGFYPNAGTRNVSADRLARFFSAERDGYRVSTDLRACIVFMVHDVLADPPLSRIDLVSCRNLLIYLSVQAQTKIISLFHFALREGGLLLLGNAETVGKPDARFEVVGEKERLYRQTGGKRITGLAYPSGERGPSGREAASTRLAKREVPFSDLCLDLLMETYAPAGVLIDSSNACLFFFGRADDYLQAAKGLAGHNVLAMARDGVRGKLRSAIRRARTEGSSVVVAGGRLIRNGARRPFAVAVQPAPGIGDGLLLVCFLDRDDDGASSTTISPGDGSNSTKELERENEALRTELEAAIRNHETFGEEQKAVNEEALSVNEEYQSTNEELISSKEELQSLNEELSALNGQLQETLEQQRTTSNDLKNVLICTDVATLFLDLDLRIRFFTPTVSKLFSIIQADIGRPLAAFASLTLDGTLLNDARGVLATEIANEREIPSAEGIWFSRRILPYRTQGLRLEGVVITFADVTDRKSVAEALELAKHEAERSDAAKSRYLAAASHDLRQPLQSLALLLGLLQKADDVDEAKSLAVRSGGSLAVMGGMLNTLLDIDRIETGKVIAEIVSFPVKRLLDALRDEFTYQANAQRLHLRVVSCGLHIATDPRLLEQMIRNLLSNALKHTRHGKVLLGCRRRNGQLSIEIWDTGIGIPRTDLKAIFEEYHQVGNALRDKDRGLGLGLAIVQRLGDLLSHRVHVRSHHGKGSVFTIDVALAPFDRRSVPYGVPDVTLDEVVTVHGAVVLIVEDDADICDLLRLTIEGEGHIAVAAVDGNEALDLVTRGLIRPDLILVDFNLPGGRDGLAVAAAVQASLHRAIPVITLTGNITNETIHAGAIDKCVRLTKPVDTGQLINVIHRLLSLSSSPPAASIRAPDRLTVPVIFVVDDDAFIRASIRAVLEADGRSVEDFPTCESFLASYDPTRAGCLLIDVFLTGMDGFELLERLAELGHSLPSIMLTGHGDVPMAVRAMRAGASDFMEKPIDREVLIACVTRALDQGRNANERHDGRHVAVKILATLTLRQSQIMERVLAGHPNKNIAADLGISQRTVENHRAAIMQKTGTKSLPALARLSFTASATR